MLVTTIDLLRHGETEGGDMFRGATDVALSANGWQQMRDTLPTAIAYDHIISSPMQRCYKFANEISATSHRPLSINQQLKEISFGDWDGQLFADVKLNDGERFNGFWRNPMDNTPPNGESLEAFYQRITVAFLQEVNAHKGKQLLMVVHGGVIKALIAYIMQSPIQAMMRIDVPYACKSQIKIYHDNENDWPQLVFHNQ